jgi:hypothetical protein
MGMFMPTRVFSCAVFAVLLSATAAVADSRNGVSFAVQAAILPDDGEPVAGAATCTLGKDCEIFTREQHNFDLSLKVHEGSSRCLSSEITLRCASGDCSFGTGYSRQTFGSERSLDFYEGSDGNELVLRRRTKIGSILLILPEFGPICTPLIHVIKG